ncbi:MAG: DUF7594 domain-containing protein [bacterium]
MVSASRPLVACLVLALPLLALSLPAHASTIVTTADGAGDDVHVRNGSKRNRTTNYNGQEMLQVKNGGSVANNAHRKAYLRFDLSAGTESITPGQIESAMLSLTPVDTGAGRTPANRTWSFSVYGLAHDHTPEDGAYDKHWPADEIDWSSAPANTPREENLTVHGNALRRDQVTLVGAFELTGKGIDQTVRISNNVLADFLSSSPDQTIAFIVVRNTPENEGQPNNYVHGFAAAEHQTLEAPTLDLTVTSEPASSMSGGLDTLRMASSDRQTPTH